MKALGGRVTAGAGAGEGLGTMVVDADADACAREGEEENRRVVCLERGRGRLLCLAFLFDGGILGENEMKNDICQCVNL